MHSPTNKKSPLLQFAINQEHAVSTLDLSEGVAYREPTLHYHTAELTRVQLAHQLILEGEDAFDDFEDGLDNLSEIFEVFIEEKLKSALEDLNQERDNKSVGELIYIFQTGMRLFYQGQEELLEALDKDDIDLFENGLKNTVDGHDYFYFGAELVDLLAA